MTAAARRHHHQLCGVAWLLPFEAAAGVLLCVQEGLAWPRCRAEVAAIWLKAAHGSEDVGEVNLGIFWVLTARTPALSGTLVVVMCAAVRKFRFWRSSALFSLCLVFILRPHSACKLIRPEPVCPCDNQFTLKVPRVSRAGAASRCSN